MSMWKTGTLPNVRMTSLIAASRNGTFYTTYQAIDATPCNDCGVGIQPGQLLTMHMRKHSDPPLKGMRNLPIKDRPANMPYCRKCYPFRVMGEHQWGDAYAAQLDTANLSAAEKRQLQEHRRLLLTHTEEDVAFYEMTGQWPGQAVIA